MKLVHIIAFLFIFGLISNGLAILDIASTSYTVGGDLEIDPEIQMGLITFQITVVLIAGLAGAIATWIGLSMVPTASGGSLPMHKIFGYGIFGGLVSVSLFGGLSTLFGIYEIIPEGAKLGAGVVLSIILAVIGFVATLGFVELTTERDLL